MMWRVFAIGFLLASFLICAPWLQLIVNRPKEPRTAFLPSITIQSWELVLEYELKEFAGSVLLSLPLWPFFASLTFAAAAAVCFWYSAQSK